MAIKKIVSLPCGIDGEYHKILGLRWDVAFEKADVLVGIYVSQNMRELGKAHVAIKEHSVDLKKSETVGQDVLAKLYSKLKELSAYADCEDC